MAGKRRQESGSKAVPWRSRLPVRALLCLAAVFLVPCRPASAEVEPANVLVLYSTGRLVPAAIEVDRAIRATLKAPGGRQVIVHDEFLDAANFGGKAHEEIVISYLRGKYAAHPPQVILAGATESVDFVLRHRSRLFPDTPVVNFATARTFLANAAPLPANFFGVPIDYDPVGTVEQALRWHPQTRRLVVVTGQRATWDREWETTLRTQFGAFEGRLAVEFLAGLPARELTARLGRLGKDAIVFTTGYFEDGDGRHDTPRGSVENIAAASSAPVYGPLSSFIGAGVVGGRVPSFTDSARQAAEIANAILAGTAPSSLRLPEVMPVRIQVDWRQVQRWGIDEDAIPGDALVHFRALSPWDTHRKEILLAAAVFLLQSILIAVLLLERRRRHAAEEAVQKQRHELAHASRRDIAAELTASIAHEINQPLGAILSNADAAEMLLESGGDRRDKLRAIISDIRRDDLRASEVIRRLRGLLGKREVERKPFDLNEAAREVEALVGADARRRGVALEIVPARIPVTVVGDRVQVQQVIINLVLNAMDAVTELPGERRRVVVSIEGGAQRACITVRDRGHGIEPENLPKLFDSFFSTKLRGMGMGLSISRNLVEAHGGHIRAENGAIDGAVFHVELPKEDT